MNDDDRPPAPGGPSAPPRHHVALLRHAKSSWETPGLSDHERPLNARGQRDTGRLLRYLQTRPIAVDLVLCSSSVRTVSTLAGIRPGLPDDVEVVVDDRLYGAGADELAAGLAALDEQVSGVLVIGHNPGIGQLAHELAGGGTDQAYARLAWRFPTGALARLTLDAPWSALDTGGCRLTEVVVPRELGAG